MMKPSDLESRKAALATEQKRRDAAHRDQMSQRREQHASDEAASVARAPAAPDLGTRREFLRAQLLERADEQRTARQASLSAFFESHAAAAPARAAELESQASAIAERRAAAHTARQQREADRKREAADTVSKYVDAESALAKSGATPEKRAELRDKFRAQAIASAVSRRADWLKAELLREKKQFDARLASYRKDPAAFREQPASKSAAPAAASTRALPAASPEGGQENQESQENQGTRGQAVPTIVSRGVRVAGEQPEVFPPPAEAKKAAQRALADRGARQARGDEQRRARDGEFKQQLAAARAAHAEQQSRRDADDGAAAEQLRAELAGRLEQARERDGARATEQRAARVDAVAAALAEEKRRGEADADAATELSKKMRARTDEKDRARRGNEQAAKEARAALVAKALGAK